MNIADIIAALSGGADPNKAILDSFQPGVQPPQGPPPGPPPVQTASLAPGAPQAPPDTGVPTGAATPFTSPAPPAAVPSLLQSPPDLANMYAKLMGNSSPNAKELDLPAQYMDMVRQRDARAGLDSGLTMIAAGLSNSPATRAALINASAAGGHSGANISAADIINLQKQQQAVKDKMIRQAALPDLMKQYNMTPAEIQALEASGKLDEVLQNFATRSLAHVTDANTGQTILVNDRAEAGSKNRVVATIGGEKEDPTQWVDGPKGPELRNSRTGDLIGGPGVGLKPTDTKKQFDDFNASLAAKGQPPIDEMTFLKMVHPGASQNIVNVSPSGAQFPKPETGYDYLRNPDNTVKVDAEGKPQVYAIPGSAAAQEADAAKKKLDKGTDKEAMAKVHEAFTASNVGEAVTEAIKHIDTPGVVGIGSKTLRSLPGPGGMPHDKFDAALKTIGSNITIQTLAQMRKDSPTGGALGNVSDFEDKMLQSVITPLATFGDKESMRKGLYRVQAAMELLANDNFNKDPAKFQDALQKRIAELGAGGKSGAVVRKRE